LHVRIKTAKRSFTTPLHMKKYFVGLLRATLLAAALPFVAQAAWAHDRGGSHFSGSHGFAFHHHDGDRFHHDHDRFFRHRFFFGFGYPFFGYPDYYPYGYYDSPYGYYSDAGSGYNDQYWSDLTAAVQSELAGSGYYHGPVNGVVTADTVRAIRAYRKAKGLPVSGQIDTRLLKSLNI
jgi:hypothetical protein